jgi:hypothetical protein
VDPSVLANVVCAPLLQLLRECATTILCDPGKHTVTHVPPFDVAADCNNNTCEFIAELEGKLGP